MRNIITKLLSPQRLPTAFILLVAAIIVSVWFRKGIMLAGAEEGLPYYHVERTFGLYTSSLYDTGLGNNPAFNIPRIPHYAGAYILSLSGLPSVLVQALIFFLLISTATLSIYRISKLYFQKESEIFHIVASIFYLCNLYTLSQIWTRFIISLFFLWAFLPLFLYLWSQYVRTYKVRYLIFVIVFSTLFSHMYVLVSPIITIWFLAAVVAVYHLYISKDRVRLVLFSCLGFTIWVIASLWFLLPYYVFSISGSGLSTDQQLNLQSLSDVSVYFKNQDIIRLYQTYMFGVNSVYHDWYSRPTITLLSWIVPIVSILGVIKLNRRKEGILFLSILFLGWFVVKGANPPLGIDFYSKIFSLSGIFQSLRNPYEKFGSFFLIGYSFAFAGGFAYLLNAIKYSRVLLSFIFVAVCGYLVLPLWSGRLYRSEMYVNVPTYYESANNLIELRSNPQSRIFHLPFLRSASIIYDWNYRGEDPSEFLFDKASVSRTFSNSKLDDFYIELGNPKLFRESSNFANILAVMNVEWIILHNDILLTPSYQENVNDTRAHIEHWNNVSKIDKLGKLEIYRVDEKRLPSRIYIVDSIKIVEDLGDALFTMASLDFDPKRDSVLALSQNSQQSILPDSMKIPEYTVNSISNTHYKVHVKKNNDPFILVLANNFSNTWEARIDDEKIPEHFEINGFSNGWVVNKKGDFTIDVVYKIWLW